jgi:hypothetical protein
VWVGKQNGPRRPVFTSELAGWTNSNSYIVEVAIREARPGYTAISHDDALQPKPDQRGGVLISGAQKSDRGILLPILLPEIPQKDQRVTLYLNANPRHSRCGWQELNPRPLASAYKFMPSASCAAASIFALPQTMASLAVSPRIQQSSMSAHTCMRTRRGPDNRAWL